LADQPSGPKNLLAGVRTQDIKLEPSFSDYAIDAARTIPGGLAQGAAAVAGLPGDVEEILNRFGDKVTGITPEQRNISRQYGLGQRLPTSAGINKVLSAPTGGYYQPKYTPGEYAQTVAEFAPGVFGGEGSWIKKGFNTAASALGSEALGRQAKGTMFETPLRIAGALIGHGASSKAQKVAETGSLTDLGAAEKATASVADKKTAADTFYNAARNSGFTITNPSFDNFKNSILAMAKKEGITPGLTKKADELVNIINDTSGDISLSNLHDIRKIASKTTMVPDKQDRQAVRLVLDKVDDYISGLKRSDVTAGDPSTAVAFLEEAKKLWRQGSQGDVIEQTIQKARDKSGPLLNDLDQQTRKAFQKLRDNARGFSRLDSEVQDAVKAVASGSSLGHNIAYGFGKLFPTTSIGGGVTAMGEAALSFLNPAAAVLPIVGIAPKVVSAVQTGRAARLASVLARGGKVAPSTPILNRETALATVLANQGAANQQRPDYESFK
jgi:hypothetical protein